MLPATPRSKGGGKWLEGHMIFDSFALSLNPTRYIPFDDRVNGAPLEIFEESEVISPPAPPYATINTFLGEGMVLEADETLTADLGDWSGPFTIAFWIQVGEGTYEPIYFMNSSNEGTIVTLQNDTLIHSFGNGTGTQSFSYGAAINLDEPNLIALTYDGTIYRLLVNDSQLTESTAYVPPANLPVRFFSSNDSGPKAITHILAADYAIDNETIWKGYSVGTRGREVKRVISGSEVNLSQGDVNSLQTSWQAYGVVVSKR